MKTIAIVLNIIGLTTFIVILYNNGLPRKFFDDETFFYSLYVFPPLINLFVILNGSKPEVMKNTWLCLFIQRKKLEEKSKINKLKSENLN